MHIYSFSYYVHEAIKKFTFKKKCNSPQVTLTVKLVSKQLLMFEIYLEFTSTYDWRREQQSTPAFLPGESHRQRSLAGYSP